MDSIREIVYLEHVGRSNTKKVLELAKRRAIELNVKNVVVASDTGETGVMATKVFKGFNVAVVTHMTGIRVQSPGRQELTEKNREIIEENGGRILTCTHAMGGIEMGIRLLYETVLPLEIIANTLKIFGDGMKVAVEVSMMAADAGLIPVDREVISIAGTWRGADTAIVVKPAHSVSFFFLEVREIIAKPRETFGPDERVFFQGSMDYLKDLVAKNRKRKAQSAGYEVIGGYHKLEPEK